MQNQNIQPKITKHAREILYSLLAILFMITLVGAVNWWRLEIRIAKNLTIAMLPFHQRMAATTGWKTYTNTEYGFEFKYPENLILENTEFTDLLKSPSSDEVFYVSKEEMDVDLTGNSGDKLTQLTEYSQVKVYFAHAPFPDSVSSFVAQDPKTKLFIRIGFKDATHPEVTSKTMNDIFFTFKFLEPVKQIDTSAWKTYTNLDFDFEVKYPATWKWNWEFIDDMGKGGFTASNDKNIFSVDFSFSKSPDISKAQSMPITIAGQNLVRYTLDSFVPEKYLVIASKFNSKNYGENITLSLTCEKVENSEKEKTNCNNLFDQFASTFKFTK